MVVSLSLCNKKIRRNRWQQCHRFHNKKRKEGGAIVFFFSMFFATKKGQKKRRWQHHCSHFFCCKKGQKRYYFLFFSQQNKDKEKENDIGIVVIFFSSNSCFVCSKNKSQKIKKKGGEWKEFTFKLPFWPLGWSYSSSPTLHLHILKLPCLASPHS